MINTLIFDFGDVFINLDKQGALNRTLRLLKIDTLPKNVTAINEHYEKGLITDSEFLAFYHSQFPWLNQSELVTLWNYIIKDFPLYRLEFLKNIAKSNRYKLILLSNTNNLHINYVKETVSFYEEFKNCFDWFFLSHEIKLRKPDLNIYEYVLKTTNTIPETALFVDDTKDNTEAAEQLNIKTWNINPDTQDVVTMFNDLKHLF